jgi:hypothetical protein
VRQYLSFPGVKGYATAANAEKRGREIEQKYSAPDVNFRWVVIVLKNGRFAPMIILNNSVPGGPGMFLGELNVCLAN